MDEHEPAKQGESQARNGSQSIHPKRPAPTGRAVRNIALLGNVCVGKTTLYDRLCRSSEHAVNIPGSSMTLNRGVLMQGPFAAPRAFQKNCAACGVKVRRRSAATGGCCSSVQQLSECRALKPKKRWGLFAEIGADPEAVAAAVAEGKPVATHLFDTPGSASLLAASEDEQVARDLVLSGQLDAVLLVADAKNLRRGLALALELAEFELPIVFNLNMLDEAEAMGIELDDAELTRHLRVSVGRTVAVENRGVRRLSELLADAKKPEKRVRFATPIERGLTELGKTIANPHLAPRGLGILLLAADDGAERWVANQLGEAVLREVREIVHNVQAELNVPLGRLIGDAFYAEANRIADRVVTYAPKGPSLLVRFGTWARQPLSGALIGLGVLVLAYYWVGAFAATFVVDWLSVHVFEGFLIPLCASVVKFIPSTFVQDAIMNEDFGLLPTGLFLAIGLVLPVLFCFYLLQAILEDSGYLPRLAILLDRVFRKLGLNGQAIIPLILGFSCITMAVITARMLPTKKERTILTLLLVLGVPCAPLMAVMLVILAKMPATAAVVVFGIIGAQILTAGFLAGKVLKGKRADLILELPQMRIPRPRVVWVKTWRRCWQFMTEAVPIFMVASFVVFLFDRIGGLEWVAAAVSPLIEGLLGLPEVAVQVFIKTGIRRESGAAELKLLSDQFDHVQLVVSMLVMTYLFPCINAAIIIIKERGLRTGAAILAIVASWALVAGAILNAICRGLGVTFT